MICLNPKVPSMQEGVGGADNKDKDELIFPKCGQPHLSLILPQSLHVHSEEK